MEGLTDDGPSSTVGKSIAIAEELLRMKEILLYRQSRRDARPYRTTPQAASLFAGAKVIV